MKHLTEDEIQKGLDEAYKKAGHNAYFSNGFEAGIAFAIKNLNEATVKREQVQDEEPKNPSHGIDSTWC